MSLNEQTKITWLPNQQQIDKAVNENPKLVDQTQVKAIMQQSLTELSAIEQRLDRLENQGIISRIIGSMTGSKNKELIILIRDLTQAQQTSIKLVLTLAVYHAQHIATMDEILDELDKAKDVNTRTAAHIEFLYEQVQMLRDAPHTRKKSVAGRSGLWIAVIVFLSVFVYFFFR